MTDEKDLRAPVLSLAQTLKEKFTSPEYIPGCKIIAITDIDEYTTDNGWIEAFCGQHNNQRVRYRGFPAGVVADDFIDVMHFPDRKTFEVQGNGGTATTGLDAVKVSQVWESDGGTIALWANDGGSIGIDTATPLALLQVGAGSDAPLVTTSIHVLHATGPNISLQDTTTNIETILGATTATGGYVGSSSDDDFFLLTGSLSRASIQHSTGNFGIGLGATGVGAQKLEVLSTGTQLRLTHTAASRFTELTVDTNHDLTITPSSTGQIILQPTTDSVDFFQVLDADGGGPVLNVDSTNERVGIGTAAPAFPLDIAFTNQVANFGDGSDNAQISIDGAAGKSRDVIYKSGGVNRWILRVDSTAESGSDVGSDLRIISRTDAGGSKADAIFIKRSNGNVGIGTIAPGSLMEWNFATEDLEFVDAGSTSATEQDWIEVQVGGNTGYIRVYATK